MAENKLAKLIVAFLAAAMLCACLLSALVPVAQKKLAGTAAPQPQTGAADGEPRSVTLREGDYVWFGAYRGEPLLWQVIETDAGGRPLLLADQVICFKAFDVPPASPANDAPDLAAYGSSVWESCSLKRWLNSDEKTVKEYGEKGFLSSDNFTAAARESIAAPGVFVPSKKQLKNAQSILLKKRCRPGAADSTDYLILPTQAVWYWTQTPNGSGRVSVVCVTSSGGFYKTLAGDKNTGVCPAFFFHTKTVTATGGDGSKAAPYSVTEGGAAA